MKKQLWYVVVGLVLVSIIIFVLIFWYVIYPVKHRTIIEKYSEIYNLDDSSIQAVSKKLSRGMLMGARGNSGVILSQLCRGLAKGFDGFEQVTGLDVAALYAKHVAQIMKK